MPDGAGCSEPRVRRVLHVSPYMHPSAGGPPVAIERWAQFSDAHGWRSRVLSTPALSSDSGRSLCAAAEGRYELVLVSSAVGALLGAARKKIRACVHEADIVHLHTMWSPLNAIAAAVCRSMGKPYVVSPHGMLDPYSLGIKSIRKRAYLRLIEHRTIGDAAGVLFTADDERDLAVSQVGPVPNAGVVGLGADTPIESRDALLARFRSAHPELADKRLILFLGRLHPKKRPDVVIEAMPAVRAKYPDASLLMVGGGEADYVAELRRLANRLGIADRVHFTGMLTGDDKWSTVAAASIFALPSRQENFAIAVAEALQLGVPVLITDKINIWREIVEAGAGLLLREDRLADDLADYAAALLGDTSRCQDMGRKARALALRAYTWPASTQKLCAYYDAILDARRARSPENVSVDALRA